MPIKENTNKVTDFVEMALESTATGLAVVSLVNPTMALAAPLFSIAALPFSAHNSSLIKKQLKTIIDEFNKLETKVYKLENLTKDQADIFLLNEHKFFEYCMKEKMKEKIQAYARIFSNGINSGMVLEGNDIFDIQMDVINSLRIEDIVLINQIYKFLKRENLAPYACEFQKENLNSFIVTETNEEETLNEYALRHLINLGLISERINATLPNTACDFLSFSDDLIFRYSLTQRCRMIHEAIMQ